MSSNAWIIVDGRDPLWKQTQYTLRVSGLPSRPEEHTRVESLLNRISAQRFSTCGDPLTLNVELGTVSSVPVAEDVSV